MSDTLPSYEKLGVFYLGRPYDLTRRETAPAPLLYDSRDLVTHAVCVGMTGSGKTGLCLSLLEEAAIDNIPAIIIDPKGDLVRDLLERIPRRHWDRVVLIDPSLREWPVGLNLLDCDDPDQHELVCDQLVTIFRKTYERFWGPRTDELLRAAVLTLLRRPDTSLSEVPLLLLQTNARRLRPFRRWCLFLSKTAAFLSRACTAPWTFRTMRRGSSSNGAPSSVPRFWSASATWTPATGAPTSPEARSSSTTCSGWLELPASWRSSCR